ncbi:MAG: hypothetical protein EHM37_09535, partial [Deltaproteobacteria bacterium]
MRTIKLQAFFHRHRDRYRDRGRKPFKNNGDCDPDSDSDSDSDLLQGQAPVPALFFDIRLVSASFLLPFPGCRKHHLAAETARAQEINNLSERDIGCPVTETPGKGLPGAVYLRKLLLRCIQNLPG